MLLVSRLCGVDERRTLCVRLSGWRSAGVCCQGEAEDELQSVARGREGKTAEVPVTVFHIQKRFALLLSYHHCLHQVVVKGTGDLKGAFVILVVDW